MFYSTLFILYVWCTFTEQSALLLPSMLAVAVLCCFLCFLIY